MCRGTLADTATCLAGCNFTSSFRCNASSQSQNPADEGKNAAHLMLLQGHAISDLALQRNLSQLHHLGHP